MSFSVSDMVIVRNERKSSRVIYATPDGDGDIIVTRQGGEGQRYVPELACTLFVSHEAIPPVQATTSSQTVVFENQSIPNQNQEKVSTMTNANRALVTVSLIDQDAGLDVTKSLVKSFGQRMLEGSEENLKQEILMSENVESVLRAHNIVREKEIDLDILKRTGNKVMLQPVKIGDLTWVISRA